MYSVTLVVGFVKYNYKQALKDSFSNYKDAVKWSSWINHWIL